MQLIGLARLGKDAETRYTPSGKSVTQLSLAYNYGKRENDQQPTQWIDAAFWGERGEKLAQYLTKGKLILVHLNDVRVETYEKKDGGSGVSLRANVLHVEFASSKGDNESAPRQSGGGQPQRAESTPALDAMDDFDAIPF